MRCLFRGRALWGWGKGRQNFLRGGGRSRAMLVPPAAFSCAAPHALTERAGGHRDAVLRQLQRNTPHGTRGSRTMNVAPRPGSLSTSIVPLCSSTRCFVIASPRPVPATSCERLLSTR